MSTIVTRAGKGSALTHGEMDSNLTNLNTDKLEAATVATLINKTVNLTSNTLTGTTAQFNTALSDNDFATQAGSETLINKTIAGANNTLNVRIANDVTGLGTGVATFLGTPSSANLASAVTDETGSGALVFGTSPTIATPTITGVYTAAGAPIISANAMAALEINVASAVNTKSIASDTTFTFSATPSTDTWFGLSVTNTDTNPHVLTIPSSYSFSLQTAITTLVIGASSRLFLQWRRTASGYELLGDTNYLNNYTATAAPAVTDDVSDGYGPGSFWLNATGNDTYICESNEAGAAIWHQLNGGGGTVSISGTPSVGQAAEWTSSAAIQGVAVTGTGSYVKATSPTLVTPALGTPSALVLTNATGLPVAGGGTGVASLTAYAPIFGGTTGTGAVQSGTVGTAGQVLTSNGAGALPTFQAAAGGSSLPFQHEWRMFIAPGITSWTQDPGSSMATIQGTIVAVSTPFNTSYAAPRGRLTASDAVVNSGVATGRGSGATAGFMPGSVDSQRVIWQGLWSPNDTNAGRRWAAGLYRNGAANPSASADPDTWVNVAVFAKRAADSNVQFITNDATSTGSATDLGANFPAASTTALYYGKITARGGATPTIDYYLKNLVTGDVASGSVTSQLPVADELLSTIMWVANGPTTASAATFEASYQSIGLQYQGVA